MIPLRIAITGATGFLGGAAARRFLRQGHQVLAHGRDPRALERLAKCGAATVGADLGAASAEDFIDGCRRFGPEAVVHAAAKSAPFGRRKDFESSNVRGTENVLKAVREAGARRLVHISTPSLYCEGEPLEFVREDHPLPSPSINHYAATKRIGEELVRRAGDQVGAIILRPRALFGPGDTALFPRLLRALEDRRLPVIGNGKNHIDLTYIDNATQAIELALFAGEGATGRTFNITGGEPVQLWPLIARLCAELGLQAPTRTVKRGAARAAALMAESLHRTFRRAGEPRLTRYSVDSLSLDATLDISAARSVLGYDPEVTMEEGIQRFIAHERAARGQR